jgi:hypothetical protein
VQFEQVQIGGRGKTPHCRTSSRAHAREGQQMSAEAPLSVARFGVGTRTCVLTIARPRPGETAACVVEWIPDLPTRLSAEELAEYRAGRDRALAAVAQRLGITAAVIEM